MKLCARHADTSYSNHIPTPQKFKPIYRSPEVGLLNRFDLWVSADSIAVISIRGTTASKQSWLENFYAAMIPAEGQLILSEKDTFKYKVAKHTQAAVHVGWMLACGYMAKDVIQKIDSCYRTGIKDVIIMGHSQGGAIAFLMTAYLRHQQMENKMASDIQFKTYCSAAPKPGNLFFAYDYEELTKGGWAFNVVNSADWVPEVPITLQTANDFNKTNPFVNAKKTIRKAKFPVDMVVLYVYNRLYKSPKRAVRKYQKYLGRAASKIVKQNLPQYQVPKFFNSSYYVRTGTTIVLYADADYYKLFPDSETNIFIHHFFEPYLYLTEKNFK
jgi:pimeloyl-ACP methyl ester carboxylesterase